MQLTHVIFQHRSTSRSSPAAEREPGRERCAPLALRRCTRTRAGAPVCRVAGPARGPLVLTIILNTQTALMTHPAVVE